MRCLIVWSELTFDDLMRTGAFIVASHKSTVTVLVNLVNKILIQFLPSY